MKTNDLNKGQKNVLSTSNLQHEQCSIKIHRKTDTKWHEEKTKKKRKHEQSTCTMKYQITQEKPKLFYIKDNFFILQTAYRITYAKKMNIWSMVVNVLEDFFFVLSIYRIFCSG